MSQLRISFERLARLLLQMPTRPAVLFLMLMRNLDEPSTYWVQAEAVEPIAKLYGLVLVSYRDAVWPRSRQAALQSVASLRHTQTRGLSLPSDIVDASAHRRLPLLCVGCHRARAAPECLGDCLRPAASGFLSSER